MKEKHKPLVVAGIVLVAAIVVALLLIGMDVNGTVVMPTPMPPTPTPEPTPGPCDFDDYCDEGETIEWCPSDCIASTGLSAERKNESEFPAETSPTVTVTMQDPQGIETCGVSPTASHQWDCVVKSPGEIISEVDCTLQDYGWDGNYMFVLRCKDGAGGDVTPVMVDDITICASPLGCAR